MNLKYSKDVVKDYDKLSDGRQEYIIKCAEKKGVTVTEYLLEKYGQ
jgi:hypothetical protein|tara:strand:+ start:281 stop:418 length:138 start_codon:yes stop_codon:yes gene_type:complete